jgi:hypothetical protein
MENWVATYIGAFNNIVKMTQVHTIQPHPYEYGRKLISFNFGVRKP